MTTQTVEITTEKTTASLVAEWTKVHSGMNRATNAILKQVDILETTRTMGARIIAELQHRPEFKMSTGRLNKSALANELGLSRTELGRFLKGIEMWEAALKSGMVKVSDTDEVSPEEVAHINTPWKLSAAAIRQARAQDSEDRTPGEKSDKSGEVTTKEAPKPGEADTGEVASVALSADDLFVKIQELANTVKMLATAGIELSDADKERAQTALAELSASI